jgi:hypothetical protein
MGHRVEVDQSIKIEQPGPTVLAFSNGISSAIRIPSDVKTAIRAELKSRGKSKQTAHLQLFAACLFILLRGHLDNLRQIVIDVEYDGNEATIKAFLLRYIWRQTPEFDQDTIVFRHIGKKSPAHKKANNVREGRDKDCRTVRREELLEILR